MTCALFGFRLRLGIGGPRRQNVGDARIHSHSLSHANLQVAVSSRFAQSPVRVVIFTGVKIFFRNRLENENPAIKIRPNIGSICSLRPCHHPLRTAPENYLLISSMPLWRRSITLSPDRCGTSSIAWWQEKRNTCATHSMASIRAKSRFPPRTLRDMVRGTRESWRRLSRKSPGF